MPQPKKYRHYFRYWDGSDYQYYFVVGGLVDIDLAMREISHAPDGWQEYELSLERGYTYFATQTSYTTPIKWYRDAAQILRHIYTTQGTNGKCQLYVEILDESDWTYSEFFKADFDFNTFLSEFDWVQANAVSGGFMTKLMSREDTEYELDLDGHADTVLIYNDGLVLQSKLLYSVGTGLAQEFTGNPFDEFPMLTYYDTEGTNVSTRFYDVDNSVPQKQFVKNNSGASIDYGIKLGGTYIILPNGSYTGGGYVTVRLLEYDSSLAFVSYHDIFIDSSAMPTGASYLLNIPFLRITLHYLRVIHLHYLISLRGLLRGLLVLPLFQMVLGLR